MNSTKPHVKTYIVDDEKQKIFGEGPYQLLIGVEKTGSLRKSAMEMSMAYTKAHGIIKMAENKLGVKLLVPTIGGTHGGGSVLTNECKLLMNKYEQYKKKVLKANEEIYGDIFGLRTGCVIMASGEGKRFGSNKLLEELYGKPLFTYILEITQGIFDKRVVVTIHKEIADYCSQNGIECILHNMPYRSDVVRLGIEYMKDDVDVCTFCLADQPLLKTESLLKMLEKVREDNKLIYRMSYNEQQGSPITYPGDLFEELRNLPEKKGGNFIIGNHPDRLRLVDVSDKEELLDIDTREDLEKILELMK